MTETPSRSGRDVLIDAAIDALEDLFFTFDQDGTLDEWNQSVVEVTGYTDEDLRVMSPHEFVATEDADALDEAIEAMREAGQATVEVDLETNAGDRIPYEFNITQLVEDGEVVGFCGIGRDVTDRRRSDRQRRAILDRMTDAFFAVDEDWRLTYVNEQARPILANATQQDLDAETLEGMDLWEAIPEAVDTPFYERYHEAMATQESVAFEEYYDPLDTWFEVRAYPSESGLSVYFRDITERRRQRAAMEERERVLREIYELTSDTDRSFDERVEALLAVGTRTLGLEYGTLSRISGEEYHFEVVQAPDDSIEAGDVVPLSATNCERTAAREATLVLADIAQEAPDLTEKDGYAEWGIAAYLGAPVFVDDGVYGTFCFYDTEPRGSAFSEWEVTLVDLMSQWVSYELTRQKTRRQLERQNDQLEEFAGIVSHDLRNPLNVLSGSLELAEDTGAAEHFERCYRAVDRMEGLIEDLLTLARAGERIEAPEPVDLGALVEDCWRTVETTAARLETDIDGDGAMLADESRLRQLLENLIRNAVEHGGDDVTVRVGTVPGGFYVEDDGPGISPEDRDAVFDSGYSTVDGGTGIGLSVVEQIAEAHGWSVSVTDAEGGGARFEFGGVERP